MEMKNQKKRERKRERETHHSKLLVSLLDLIGIGLGRNVEDIVQPSLVTLLRHCEVYLTGSKRAGRIYLGKRVDYLQAEVYLRGRGVLSSFMTAGRTRAENLTLPLLSLDNPSRGREKCMASRSYLSVVEERMRTRKK
jgi:hypothetical protein